MEGTTWYLRTQDETFGPETQERILEWAQMGRVQPGQEISTDNVNWRRVEDVPFLDMRFSIDIGDGHPRGPFNRVAAESLIASGRLPGEAKIVEVCPPPLEPAEPEPEPVATEPEPVVQDPEPVAQDPELPLEFTGEEVQKPGADPEIAPVEKIVEKIVEVPVEKIVEKIVEVPVEKIVEKVVEKVIVDDAKVNELQMLLDEANARLEAANAKIDDSAVREGQYQAKVKEFQELLDESKSHLAAQEAAVADRDARLAEKDARISEIESKVVQLEGKIGDASNRESKMDEQIKSLEDQLRRLPQAASEVADIQSAMYSIITGESEELRELIEIEKAEADEFRKRYQVRADRMLERRRELLKRAGANIEDMTRKSLMNRPEDPRTVQLRKELDQLRSMTDKVTQANEARIRELEETVRRKDLENRHAEAGRQDVTQLQQEVQSLLGKLQLRERELVEARQENENLRKNQALSQQTLMTRIAALESPSIAQPDNLATNQSREAKMVRLPSWMRLGK